MLELRDYQKECQAAQWRYWATNKGQSPLIVAPTGAGKSILIADTIRSVIKAAPHANIMLVSHIKELLVQDMEELMQLAPELSMNIGVLCAGLNRKETDKQITFASVQTAFNADLRKVNLLIIDEAHLVGRNDSSMYGQLIAKLRTANPSMRIAGYTATPYRLDTGKLTEGDNALFDGVAYEVKLKKLIDDGFLVPPITKGRADMENLTIQAGEYTSASQEFFLKDHIELYAENIAKETDGEHVTLCFLPSVAYARKFAELLCTWGCKASWVSGDMEKQERDNRIDRFKNGDISHMCNVNLLTTGSNIPQITAIVLLRATKSTNLYVQMVGRGLRLHPDSDKANCIVYDYGGNAVRHGPLNKPFSFTRDRSRSGIPVGRICQGCGEVLPARLIKCDVCGEVIEMPERRGDPKLDINNYYGDLVGYSEQPKWVRCWNFSAQEWNSKAGNRMLCFSYRISGHDWPIREWVNPESGPRSLLGRKFRQRARSFGIADELSIDQALAVLEKVSSPKYVKIARKIDTKFYDVFDVSYEDDKDNELDDFDDL